MRGQDNQVIFWESWFGGMSLQQCQSRDSPIEPCTALKIGGGQVAQVKRWWSVGDVDEWVLELMESQGALHKQTE